MAAREVRRRGIFCSELETHCAELADQASDMAPHRTAYSAAAECFSHIDTVATLEHSFGKIEMIPRAVKGAYYMAARVPMSISSRVYRFMRAPKQGLVKVHLGPGQKGYLDGWVNVDANIVSSRPDVWADLRDALPFRTNTVDVFYSHHMIEHLPDACLPFHFSEMYRCLKPGGVIRIGGPNGDIAIKKFVEGDGAWFSDFPDVRRSVGGRFANFILCRGEHLTILTRSYLEELLTDAGFADLQVCAPVSETSAPDLIGADVLGLESESTPLAPHTLVIEARKRSAVPAT